MRGEAPCRPPIGRRRYRQGDWSQHRPTGWWPSRPVAL